MLARSKPDVNIFVADNADKSQGLITCLQYAHSSLIITYFTQNSWSLLPGRIHDHPRENVYLAHGDFFICGD